MTTFIARNAWLKSPWLGAPVFLLGGLLIWMGLDEARYCLAPSWRDWALVPGCLGFFLGGLQLMVACFSGERLIWLRGTVAFLLLPTLGFGLIFVLFGSALHATGLVQKYELQGQRYCLLSGSGGFGKYGLNPQLYDQDALGAGPIASAFSDGLNSGEPTTWHETIPLHPMRTGGESFLLRRQAIPPNVCDPLRTETPCLDFPYALERVIRPSAE